MKEKEFRAISGWAMLFAAIIFIVLGFVSYYHAAHSYGREIGRYAILGVVLDIASIFTFLGLFTVQPNEARVLILFGKYRGTVREEGFRWANPFSVTHGRATFVEAAEGAARKGAIWKNKYRVSLRARNFQTPVLKVNDQRGNPVEIAVVVVWRVVDTAQALFDVDDYENYVRVQTESAIRHVASQYAYDQGEADEITLRSGTDEVCAALGRELQERLAKAGVMVEEARLTHLAYAPEIASAMLRRQQAEAVIAAREKIVHGAVSMVDMALRELADKQVVQLDDERKAAMVSNLMVVLCGESEVHPVVNAGSLYT